MGTTSISRRGFMKTAGTGAAALWAPGGAAARPLDGPVSTDTSGIGMSKWDLDTPVLCVDLDKMEQNIETMQMRLGKAGMKSRPHAKTHKCPAIAKLQMASGSIGISTAKVSEAEVFAEQGIERIMMTTSNVTSNKIRRAMAIRKRVPGFVQAVDHPDNARQLSDAAREAGIIADVVVDVAVGTRTGVPPGEQALALAQIVDKLPGLKFRGMLAYDGGAQHIKGFKTRLEQTLKRFEAHVATYEMMKRAGLNMEIFSGGGTGTYNILTKVPGMTDLQVGSYIFMDCQYLEIGGEDNEEIYSDFAPSLTVMSTVMNTYFPGRITTDAGAKALTLNKPGPIVIGENGFKYDQGSDEFGVIQYENSSKSYKVGDRLELIVPHCDPAVNEYDQIYGTRKDRVEVIWPIAARGHSQ